MVSIIDVNAADAREAAVFTYRIMSDPESVLPVLKLIDHADTTVTVDMSAT
jgi:hypothetical protein